MFHLQSFFFFKPEKALSHYRGESLFVGTYKMLQLFITFERKTQWDSAAFNPIIEALDILKWMEQWPALSQGNSSQSFMSSLHRRWLLRVLILALSFSGCFDNCRKGEVRACAQSCQTFLHLTVLHFSQILLRLKSSLFSNNSMRQLPFFELNKQTSFLNQLCCIKPFSKFTCLWKAD